MHRNLVDEQRTGFFFDVLTLIAELGAQVVVVIVDTEANSATEAPTPEEDATRLFLERASNRFGANDNGIVIIDRPSGRREDENAFLAGCVEHLLDERTFAIPERFALPVIATQSRFVRLLQVADLVTSCTLAHVSGEARYSPPVFQVLATMFPGNLGRRGGVGLKLHPDYRYANVGSTDRCNGLVELL